MGCQITSGIDDPCGYSQGGVKAIYVTNRADIASFTTAGTAGRIDSITMAVGKVFFPIGFAKGFANYEEGGVKGNGSKFMTQTLSFQTGDSSQETANAYEEIYLANDLAFILENNNGGRFAFGFQTGMEATEVKRMGGTKPEDFAGFMATISGTNNGFALELASALTIPV